MGSGVRLAIAILVLFLAMVAFFFAFHPAGVENGAIRNPVDILQWMFGRFDDAVAGNDQGSKSDVGSSGPEPKFGSTNSSQLTNVPGTNVGLTNTKP